MATNDDFPIFPLRPDVHRDIGLRHFRNFFEMMRALHGDEAHDRYIEAAFEASARALIDKYGRRSAYGCTARIVDAIIEPELQ